MWTQTSSSLFLRCRPVRGIYVLGLFMTLCYSSWVHAQKQPGFGEICVPNTACKPGLICARNGEKGVCVYACDARTNLCPHGETCKVQQSGLGACFCVNSGVCPKNTKCDSSTGQCVGTSRAGELCNDEKRCAWNLYCSQPKGASKKRCRPLCTGLACSDALKTPCTSVENTPFSVCFCKEDKDCPRGVCINGACKSQPELGEPCTSQVSCAEGFHCVIEQGKTRGLCHSLCTSSDSCVTGEPCVRASGRKVCMCSFQRLCEGGATCKGGFCEGRTSCSASRPCPVSQVCFFPRTSNSKAVGVCVDSCSSAKQCSEQPCMQISRSKSGCFCRKNSDCGRVGRECVRFQCRDLCREVNQCKAGLTCRNGSCVSPEPGDAISEKKEAEPTQKDAGPREPSKPPEPICKPACVAPFRCNPTTRKCEKLKLTESCQKDSECQSGLCFGNPPSKPKICSTTDCSKCKEFFMKCESISGKTACYTIHSKPNPPTPEQPTCGCSSANGQPFWFVFLVILCWGLRWGRKQELHTR